MRKKNYMTTKPPTTKQIEHWQGRLDALTQFDLAQLKQNKTIDAIIGVDEVGRGSLIGPVVAAAACFPVSVLKKPKNLLGLDDSKASFHTHESRVLLSKEIQKQTTWAITEATQDEVETLNIHQASLLASKRAILSVLAQLNPSKCKHILILMDGRHTLKALEFDDFKLTQAAIVKGDGKSASIASASILAKANRDQWVLNLFKSDEGLTRYGWQTNMGYATPSHRAAIEAHGPTYYHRKTFQLKTRVEK